MRSSEKPLPLMMRPKKLGSPSSSVLTPDSLRFLTRPYSWATSKRNPDRAFAIVVMVGEAFMGARWRQHSRGVDTGLAVGLGKVYRPELEKRDA
jgi:hypothetical protein